MNIKPLFILLALTVTAQAQEKEFFYAFNANWKSTTIDSAHFFIRIHPINDSCWQWDYYNIFGPLLQTEQYRDKDGKELDGVSHHYNKRGWMDSISVYVKGKKNGDFVKFNGDTLRQRIKYVYKDDSLVEVADFSKEKDSVVKYKDEKESEYPGHEGRWQLYLARNLRYPERALNSYIQGEVRILFVIDKEGNVQDPYIIRSVEYSLDEESLRIIRGSGKWIPAFQNGKFLKSYKMRLLRFKLEY